MSLIILLKNAAAGVREITVELLLLVLLPITAGAASLQSQLAEIAASLDAVRTQAGAVALPGEPEPIQLLVKAARPDGLEATARGPGVTTIGVPCAPGTCPAGMRWQLGDGPLIGLEADTFVIARWPGGDTRWLGVDLYHSDLAAGEERTRILRPIPRGLRAEPVSRGWFDVEQMTPAGPLTAGLTGVTVTAVGADGLHYSSAPTQTTIERVNGAVAIVHVDGQLQAERPADEEDDPEIATGPNYRLTYRFERDNPAARLRATLTGGGVDAPHFGYTELAVDFERDTAGLIRYVDEDGAQTTDGAAVTLLQGYIQGQPGGWHYSYGRDDYDPPARNSLWMPRAQMAGGGGTNRDPADYGLSVVVDGETVRESGPGNNGHVRAVDVDGFAVALQHGPALPSSGYDVTAGRVRVLLYRGDRRTLPATGQRSHVIGYGLADVDAVYRSVAAPVTARPATDRWQQHGAAMPGWEHLQTADVIKRYFRGDWPRPEHNPRRQTRTVTTDNISRRYDYPEDGDLLALYWLIGGDGGAFLSALDAARHEIDAGQSHVDDVDERTRAQLTPRLNEPDSEHVLTTVVAAAAYVTGERYYRLGAERFFRWVVAYYDTGFSNLQRLDRWTYSNPRVIFRQTRQLLLAHDAVTALTGQSAPELLRADPLRALAGLETSDGQQLPVIVDPGKMRPGQTVRQRWREVGYNALTGLYLKPIAPGSPRGEVRMGHAFFFVAWDELLMIARSIAPRLPDGVLIVDGLNNRAAALRDFYERHYARPVALDIRPGRQMLPGKAYARVKQGALVGWYYSAAGWTPESYTEIDAAIADDSLLPALPSSERGARPGVRALLNTAYMDRDNDPVIDNQGVWYAYTVPSLCEHRPADCMFSLRRKLTPWGNDYVLASPAVQRHIGRVDALPMAANDDVYERVDKAQAVQ